MLSSWESSIKSRVCDSVLSARGASQRSVQSQKLQRGTWEEGNQEVIGTQVKLEGTASVGRAEGRDAGECRPSRGRTTEKAP